MEKHETEEDGQSEGEDASSAADGESGSPPFAYEQGTVPGPEEREEESEATDDTRFDRLRGVEQEERREAADRLLDDPLVERLENDSA